MYRRGIDVRQELLPQLSLLKTNIDLHKTSDWPALILLLPLWKLETVPSLLSLAVVVFSGRIPFVFFKNLIFLKNL